MRYFLTYIILVSTLSPALAQTEMTYPQVDSVTLDLFYDKNWNDLLEVGEEAINKGIDYYYLRYRLGVALYEKKNFFKSARHFEKAASWNNGDPVLQEYLYYSYKFSAREDEALVLSTKFSPGLLKKLDIRQKKPFDFIYLEGGLKLSSNTDSVSNMIFGSLGLQHRLSPRLTLYHAFSIINQDYRGLDYYQYGYYCSLQYFPGNGFSLIPSTHFQYLKDNTRIQTGPGNSPFYSEKSFEELAWAIQLSLKKNIDRVSFLPSFSYASQSTETKTTERQPDPPGFMLSTEVTNERVQSIQTGLEIGLIPPILQDHFWLSGYVGFQWKDKDAFFIGKIKTGLRINKLISAEAGYYYTNSTLFLADRGALFYNAFSIMQDQAFAVLKISPSKGTDLLVSYQFERKKEQYFDFYYHTILTGIKFNL